MVSFRDVVINLYVIVMIILYATLKYQFLKQYWLQLAVAKSFTKVSMLGHGKVQIIF